MTNTEILKRISRYALEAEQAASDAWVYNSNKYTRIALDRAIAAREVAELEVRWSKGEIVLREAS